MLREPRATLTLTLTLILILTLALTLTLTLTLLTWPSPRRGDLRGELGRPTLLRGRPVGVP